MLFRSSENKDEALKSLGLYAAYLKISKYDAEKPTHQHPWTVLFVSGLVLVAGSFG